MEQTKGDDGNSHDRQSVLLYFFRTNTVRSGCLNFQLAVLGSTTWGCGSLAAWLLQFVWIVQKSLPCWNTTYSPCPHFVYSWSGSHLLSTAGGATGTWTSPADPRWCGTGAAAAGPRGGEETLPLSNGFTVVLQMAGAQQWRWQFSQSLPHLPVPLALPQVRSCSAQPVNPLWLFLQTFSNSCFAKFDNAVNMLRRTKCFVFM